MYLQWRRISENVATLNFDDESILNEEKYKCRFVKLELALQLAKPSQ